MRKIIVICAALAALPIVACTPETQSQRVEATPTTPGPSLSPPTATLVPDDAVQLVSIKAADVPRGTVLELVPGGDQVAGQVTLDECGVSFSSESSRVARRQVRVRYPGDDTAEGGANYSNEVVAYDTAAHAELALEQWRTAVQNCPDDEYRESAVPGIPAVRTELLEFHSLASLPVPNNAVARQVVTTRAGRSLFLAVVYMQHGELLNANYLTTAIEPSSTQVARLTRQAQKTGGRLITLPGGTQA